MPTPIYPIPSYGEMAHDAYESVAPNFWDGLAGAWIPALGITGATNMLDALNRGYDGTFDKFVFGDWVNDIYGPALDLEKQGNNIDTLKIPAQFLSDNFGSHGIDPLTMAVLFKPEEAVTFCPLLDTTDRHMTMMYSTGGGSNGFFGIGTAQGTVAFDFPVGEWSVGIFCVRRGITNIFGYVNGVETFAISGTPTTFSDELEIGGNPSGSGTIKERRIGGVYIWKRDLTVQEIRDLSDDPFLPFRLRVNRVFNVPTVPTGGPPKGSLALLGVGI